MRIRPDRSTFLLLSAIGTLVFWVASWLGGLHPDGAILGFSGTLWMIWATSEREERQRIVRKIEERHADQVRKEHEHRLEEHERRLRGGWPATTDPEYEHDRPSPEADP